MAMYSLASYYEATGQKRPLSAAVGHIAAQQESAFGNEMNVMRQFVVQNEQDGRDSTRVISLFDRILEQEPDDAGIPMFMPSTSLF